MNKNNLKCRILLCGLPNAGKSTLMNKICSYDLALVNKKPQTTRKEQKFFYENTDYKILFIDSPGFHFSNNKLDDFMNKEITKNFRNVDCVCLIYSLVHDLNEETICFLNKLHKCVKDKLVIIFTKSDLIKDKKIISVVKTKFEEINKFLKTKIFFTTYWNDKDFFLKLFKSIEPFFLNDKYFFLKNSDNDNFLISEKIRGITLDLLHQEIPYGIHVVVEEKKYDELKKVFYVKANIVCESESKKKIIIGSKGLKIKEIGIQSRKELLKIFNTKIYLDLNVKVIKNWRNDINFIKKNI